MDKQKYPLVSIVFTSYNHQEFLRQALESLVNQTYPNLEIIIIDDCSTDGSQSILKEYEHLENVTLKLSTVNSGSYVRSSNLGASFATGEYIMFAQCDDYAEPNQIEELMKVFYENPSIGVAFSQSNLVNEKGVVLSNDYFGRSLDFKKAVHHNSIIEGEQMRCFLSFSCVIPNLSAAIIRHQLLKDINGISDQFLVVADWEMWLNLSERTRFYYIKKPLNNFRQHATTIRSQIKMKTQIVEVYAMFYNHLNSYHLSKKEKTEIRKGAGAVWFSYFLQNKRTWVNIFGSTISAIKKHEKRPLLFLFLGTKRHVVEFINRKLN